MLNNFVKKKKYIRYVNYTLILFSLLLNNVSAEEKTNLMSMSIGGYSTNYSGDFLYTVEGDSGSIPFNKKSDFGAAVEYSRVISSRFTLDSSLSYYSRTNKVKSTTCRDSSTNMPVSCNVSLNSRFRALSIFGTYRHPIGLFSKVYLGSGISINKLEQEISVKADGYEEKSINTKSSSLKTNLGFKLGASYKKLYVEYVYLGPTNKAEISALGVSSLSIGFVI